MVYYYIGEIGIIGRSFTPGFFLPINKLKEDYFRFPKEFPRIIGLLVWFGQGL